MQGSRDWTGRTWPRRMEQDPLGARDRQTDRQTDKGKQMSEPTFKHIEDRRSDGDRNQYFLQKYILFNESLGNIK